MKIQNVKRPIKLFFLANFLFPFFYAIISVPLTMFSSLVGLLGNKYGSKIFMYLIYFLFMDMIFYGGSKKQNRYLFSLEQGKTYTLKDDFFLFLFQEGFAVMETYAIYGIFCFLLGKWIPESNVLIVNILKLSYRLPILPAYFMNKFFVIEYLICLTSFCAMYIFVMMFHRAMLRKRWL